MSTDSVGNSTVLALGIGNPFRRDDGAGAQALRLLQAKGVTVDCLAASGEGSALMEAWAGRSQVIIFDAVRAHGEGGTLHRIDAAAQTVPSDYFHYSTHAFSLAEAVELARALGDLPERVVIYGIEGSDFGSGEQISPAVQLGIERAVDLAMADFSLTPI